MEVVSDCSMCDSPHETLPSSPSGCHTPAAVHMTAWINCLLYRGMNLFSQRDIRLDEMTQEHGFQLSTLSFVCYKNGMIIQYRIDTFIFVCMCLNILLVKCFRD